MSPNLFIFYENWRSREELDQHLQTPMLTSFWARRLDLLEKDVEIKFAHDVGVKPAKSLRMFGHGGHGRTWLNAEPGFLPSAG